MTLHQPIILGITGGIACGKTEAGRFLAAEGFDVLDSDETAHDLMAAGTPVHEALVLRFGPRILGDNGEIDRKKLGRIVFDDAAAREELNRLIHPAVMAAGREWIAERRAARRDAAVLVPLLFEAGWTGDWDAVICIAAPEEEVFRRLEKRGLSADEARKRIAAQMPQAEKAARADFAIENGGTLHELHVRLRACVERIRCEKKEPK